MLTHVFFAHRLDDRIKAWFAIRSSIELNSIGCLFFLACVQIFHSGLHAKISPTPKGTYCILAWVQKLHFGQAEIFALRPACIFCILGIQRANNAFKMGAKSARLVGANFARDSYHYLNTTLIDSLEDL